MNRRTRVKINQAYRSFQKQSLAYEYRMDAATLGAPADVIDFYRQVEKDCFNDWLAARALVRNYLK